MIRTGDEANQHRYVRISHTSEDISAFIMEAMQSVRHVLTKMQQQWFFSGFGFGFFVWLRERFVKMDELTLGWLEYRDDTRGTTSYILLGKHSRF